MNKHDLIDAIPGQLGSKKTATEAVNALLDTIQVTVAKGDKVAITGFGVFEKAVRPARTARNPATGCGRFALPLAVCAVSPPPPPVAAAAAWPGRAR
jgi:DNA-binding protein HU-beta